MGTESGDWAGNMTYLAIAIVMVILNGFFVAAEFALVKVRGSQLEELVASGARFAKTAHWLGLRLDASLSACQLGITMASLALGWVGEPAFASLLQPVFLAVGITSAAVLHTTSLVIAFTIITVLHLVLGEQAPKIYAIRRPEQMILWCALPLKFFYLLFYPFLIALSFTTASLLRRVGIQGATEHAVSPHTEAEIRALVQQSHGHGELSPSEHRLIHGVFEFDDTVCRSVMVPRSDVVFLEQGQNFADCLAIFKESQHTRYPLCQGSLEHLIGIVHVKDLLGFDAAANVDLSAFAREAHYVPESMQISEILSHFQQTHQLMAMVVDEHGTVIGVVTLENVLERIIGAVEDEFDAETPAIEADGEGGYIVQGSTLLETINEKFDLHLAGDGVETFAGLMGEQVGRVLNEGDSIQLPGLRAEVMAVEGARAKIFRVVLADSVQEEEEEEEEAEPAQDEGNEESKTLD